MEKDVKVSNVSVFKINEIDKEKTDKNVTSESDYLEDCIGANGIWQTFVSFAILTRSIAMFNMISIVFLTPTTDYLCIEFKDNITIEARNGTCYENCTKYVFHSEAMRTTLISEFGLICDREWMASFSQTIIMCGVVFGVSIFGWISDRFGRRVALISSSLLNVITMIPASFVSSYWMFNCLRFVTGIASGGSLIVAIPVIMEITGKRYREYAGATCLLPDGIAQALLALYAYYLPNWDSYLLGLGVTCILILILVCFVPESPRWLVANGKVDNALKIMFGAAKVPLCLVEIALTRLFKRRTAIASAFLVTGVSMTGLIFTPEGHWATTLLGVVGFSASSATYAVTYLCQAELFPTPLRNMSFGIVSAAGKVGSMIAPFIANMSPKWVPSLIFSVLSVVAVGFCLLLPETKGKNLKDTID
ncbi:solute carrier family 22 member 13 isoform X2 [Bicyclus anynana]|uniref:Solute carrier family 22 member 13 isoform X2 n=1 Tax=Bicyclus anynana TaxID=110368 RepID=A0A6J1N1B9_BICAN|nr:solute carrier family 22 member 13 isoform X2 [Bicyclus anynana]